MSNGYLVTTGLDAGAIGEIADGFELDIIAAHNVTDSEAVGAALAGAANVGIVLSFAAARDDSYVALLKILVQRLRQAQLILVEPDALRAFAFFPALWPAMPLEDARDRALAMLRSRPPAPAVDTGNEAEPEPVQPPSDIDEHVPAPVPEDTPTSDDDAPTEIELAKVEDVEDQPPAPATQAEPLAPEPEPQPEADAGALDASAETQEELARVDDETVAAPSIEEAKEASVSAAALGEIPEMPRDEEWITPPQTEAEAEPAPDPLAVGAPPPQSADEAATTAPAPARKREAEDVTIADRAAPRGSGVNLTTAPADASAFAPKKLRRGEAELVRIAIHQPKDLKAVIKSAKKADPRTDAAPHSMSLGDLALEVSIGVALEVKGGDCNGEIQRRIWRGDPLDFSFALTPSADVKQVIVLGRVFVDDAQIGVLAFKRDVVGPKPKALSDGERVKLKRHKRVFLSYSSKDRETVSSIATAYAAAGVAHFWDRASLKSGEIWSPRLRREIERCDLFHLCWSKSAAKSQWVKRETLHALERKRRKASPDISIQMLDGPPWAAHPPELDALNFDDFVRAAIVGYARGDGET